MLQLYDIPGVRPSTNRQEVELLLSIATLRVRSVPKKCWDHLCSNHGFSTVCINDMFRTDLPSPKQVQHGKCHGICHGSTAQPVPLGAPPVHHFHMAPPFAARGFLVMCCHTMGVRQRNVRRLLEGSNGLSESRFHGEAMPSWGPSSSGHLEVVKRWSV